MKQHVIWILVTLLGLPIGADALPAYMPVRAGLQPLPVEWPQDSINLNQLENVFSQNPGFQQFQIQFPNGLNWNITPAGIQALCNEYSQTANALGYNQLPPLSFSSLESTVLNSGMTTIPIRDGINSMQQEADAALSALKDQESDFMNSLPDWLREALEMIANGFMVLYSFARDEISALFR